MAIVFTDSFTVAADTPLLTYNVNYGLYGPNSTGTYNVNAAVDRCYFDATDSDRFVAISGANIPTGDQQATASWGSQGTVFSAGGRIAVRVSNNNFYLIYRVFDEQIALLRLDDGIFVVLQHIPVSGFSGEHVVPNTGLRVVGTNPVVITPIYNGVDLTSINDSSANRKITGLPGFGVFHRSDQGVNNANFIDNFVVDDLIVGGPPRASFRRAVGTFPVGSRGWVSTAVVMPALLHTSGRVLLRGSVSATKFGVSAQTGLVLPRGSTTGGLTVTTARARWQHAVSTAPVGSRGWLSAAPIAAPGVNITGRLLPLGSIAASKTGTAALIGRLLARGTTTASKFAAHDQSGRLLARSSVVAGKFVVYGQVGLLLPRSTTTATKIGTTALTGQMLARGATTASKFAAHGQVGQMLARGTTTASKITAYGQVGQLLARGATTATKIGTSSQAGLLLSFASTTYSVVSVTGTNITGLLLPRSATTATKIGATSVVGLFSARGATTSSKIGVFAQTGHLLPRGATTSAKTGIADISGRLLARGSTIYSVVTVGVEMTGRLLPLGSTTSVKLGNTAITGRLMSSVSTTASKTGVSNQTGRLLPMGSAAQVPIAPPAVEMVGGGGPQADEEADERIRKLRREFYRGLGKRPPEPPEPPKAPEPPDEPEVVELPVRPPPRKPPASRPLPVIALDLPELPATMPVVRPVPRRVSKPTTVAAAVGKAAADHELLARRLEREKLAATIAKAKIDAQSALDRLRLIDDVALIAEIIDAVDEIEEVEELV